MNTDSFGPPSPKTVGRPPVAVIVVLAAFKGTDRENGVESIASDGPKTRSDLWRLSSFQRMSFRMCRPKFRKETRRKQGSKLISER